MILQALVKLYDDLVRRGEISRPGWSKVRVGYALCINGDGELLQIVPLVEEVTHGNKTVIANQIIELPLTAKSGSAVRPNFLWDNSSYFFGVDNSGKDKRNLDCFEASKQHHKRLLGKADTPIAKAIVNFFEKWDPSEFEKNESISEFKEDILKGTNLVFRVEGVNPQEDGEIADIWQKHYEQADGMVMQCLISGETDIIEATHPLIKNVTGAQTAGAALVSFNGDAFCSYNRKQNFNAPVGKKAAFAYTTALNHLLADRENVQHIGDTTVVCWVDGAEPQYQALSLAALFGASKPDTISQDDLRTTVRNLAQGKPVPGLNIDPSKEFYILGLAPNAARLSVRFFLRTSFGDLMRNVNAHHERTEITGSRYEMIPLWALLRETVNLNSKDKSPSPNMAGATARAIFGGTVYPASLLEATMLRIRAEREITSGRAAIIKAYYLKNTDIRCPKEVLTVSLNEKSTNIPYTIGRLFAVYEAVQEAANPGINATIKDKYFNSVAATPAHILPILDSLCQKHLRKLDTGKRIYFDKQIGELKNIMGEENPVRLSLPEQGSFYLGYYHQKQKRFEKEKKENN